jgi:GNAT superfamily N-acetyltransferase
MTAATFIRLDPLTMQDYASGKSRAEKLSEDEGKRIAANTWKNVLKNGHETPGHHFLSVFFEDGKEIGMIWFKEERDWEVPYAFLNQVSIWSEHQGRGLGRALMKAFEAKCSDLGLQRIRLHVFGFNERARKLYESMGFEMTNIVMMKDL